MKKILTALAAVIILLSTLLFWFFHERRERLELLEKQQQMVIEAVLQSLTLEEKVDQMLFYFSPYSEKKQAPAFYTGAIMLLSENLPQGDTPAESRDLLRSFIEKTEETYLAAGRIPPFFAVDQEGGRVNRISYLEQTFASPMATAIAAAGPEHPDEKLPVLTGYLTCTQLKELGIDWNLAPSADVMLENENPIIRTRAFSTDPEKVALYAGHFAAGTEEAGCLAALKHFPGHGSAYEDSHLTLPSINKSEAQLLETDLHPFYKILTENPDISSVMSAHIVYEQIDSLPATISEYWMQQQLRERLEFDNIIVSDDIGMRAITEGTDYTAAELALRLVQAGIDMILLYRDYQKTGPAVRSALLKAVENGIIKQKRIDASARRIIREKLLHQRLDSYLRTRGSQHPVNSSPELREAVATLLKYSEQLDRERTSLLRRLPAPEKIDEHISRSATVRVYGRPLDFTKLQKESLPLYADIDRSSTAYHRLKRAGYVLEPLENAFKARESDSEIWLLNTDKTFDFKDFISALRLKKQQRLVILSLAEPYPCSSFTGRLAEKDTAVNSMSMHRGAIEALVNVLVEKRQPRQYSICGR